MKNLESYALSQLDEVRDEKNFIVTIEDMDGWVEILQGTRKEIFVKLIDIFRIEEDEFDNMLDILIHVEDINGDGHPLVKIYTL
tara:strand:+ start:201 stop:452 length:252 start_codon:yes stop_codon:yes gene_type:complete